MSDIKISDNPSDVDFEFVYGFLSCESNWADGIGRRTQQRAINNSLCVSAFQDDKQIGFARVITDYATFAWVDDVFVDAAARRTGVAKLLIQTIVEHPRLSSVASWWLSSSNPSARALFKQYGFGTPEQSRIEKWMGRPKVKTEAYRQ